MSQSETQKRKRAERTREFLGQLAERYPACFTREREKIRPLAIGIQKDLRAELDASEELKDTPNWLIRQALALYTRSMSYKEAIIAGRPRINLHGQDAGEINDDEKAHAQAELEKQREARQARRPARQRRPRPTRKKREPQEPSEDRLQQLAAKFNQH